MAGSATIVAGRSASARMAHAVGHGRRDGNGRLPSVVDAAGHVAATWRRPLQLLFAAVPAAAAAAILGASRVQRSRAAAAASRQRQHGGQPAQPPLPPPPQPASSPATSWTEHHTPEGLKYYYNNVSCQSSWECPAELRQGGTAQSASPAASQMPVSAAGSTAATAAFSSLAAPACALAPAMAALSMTSSPPVSMAMSQGIGLPMGGEHQQPIGGSTITSGGMSYSASNNSFSNGSIGSGLSGLPNKVNGRGEGLGQVLPGLGALGAGAVGGEVNGTILPSNFSEQELQSAFTSFGNITSCEKLPSR